MSGPGAQSFPKNSPSEQNSCMTLLCTLAHHGGGYAGQAQS